MLNQILSERQEYGNEGGGLGDSVLRNADKYDNCIKQLNLGLTV